MSRANIVPISCQYRCQYIPHTPYRYWHGNIPSGRPQTAASPPPLRYPSAAIRFRLQIPHLVAEEAA
jgi:hypothetical protein